MGYRHFLRDKSDDLVKRFRMEAGAHGLVYVVDISPERQDFTDAGFLGVVEEWMGWIGSVLECEPVYAFYCEGGSGERERFHVHGMISVGGRMDPETLSYRDMEERLEELLGNACRVECGHRYAREVESSLAYRRKAPVERGMRSF